MARQPRSIFHPETGLLERFGTRKTVQSSAYRDDLDIKEVIIYEGVVELENYAFCGCKNLESVQLPNGLKRIGWGVFKDCKKLKNIVIPDTVEELGQEAFRGCSSLENLSLPDSVQEIGWSAFESSGIKYMKIPEGIGTIAASTFEGCKNLETVDLPESCLFINTYAFKDCLSLREIKLPEKLSGIYCGAFFKCVSLKSIVIPGHVIGIDEWAFASCFNLEHIVLEEGIIDIGRAAFRSSGLRSVKLPDSLTKLLDFTFESCVNLSEVILGKNLEEIGRMCFASCCKLKSITIPAATTCINGTLVGPEMNFLEQIVVEEGNPVYDSRDNCNAIIHTASNNLLCGCINTKIPKSVKIIGNGAFTGCGFKEFRIPEWVTYVRYQAFAFCGEMRSIYIPKSVTKMFAFGMGCRKLTTIKVEEGNPVYDSRDNCNALIETATNTLLQGCNETVIPATVEHMGKECFYESGITNIVIPGSIKIIPKDAFQRNYYEDMDCVVLEEGVEEIQEGAFGYGYTINRLVLPKSIKTVEYCAFYERCVHFHTKINNLEIVGSRPEIEKNILYENLIEISSEDMPEKSKQCMAARRPPKDGPRELDFSHDTKRYIIWELLEKAEQGDADAQNRLGYECASGYRAYMNYEEAIKWLRKSAEQGNASAQYNLGICYENGYGVPKNAEEAEKWYKMSAEQGQTELKYILGVYYYEE